MDCSASKMVSWTIYNAIKTQRRCYRTHQLSTIVHFGDHRYDVYGHSTFDDQNDIAALYDTSISKYNYLSHDFHYDDIFYK